MRSATKITVLIGQVLPTNALHQNQTYKTLMKKSKFNTGKKSLCCFSCGIYDSWCSFIWNERGKCHQKDNTAL